MGLVLRLNTQVRVLLDDICKETMELVGVDGGICWGIVGMV